MDLDTLRRLLADNEGLRRAAGSPEARRLAGSLDGRALEQAAAGDDPAALRRALETLLASPEGRRLARQVSDAVKTDG